MKIISVCYFAPKNKNHIERSLEKNICTKVFQGAVLEFAHLCSDLQTSQAGITRQPNLPVHHIHSTAVSISCSFHKGTNSRITL